ncbi:MAG TPA: hypothetical protein DIC34_05965 [Treponema sp.]|nr:MAG: hypothetical protein A2001_10700 [Treponema sp. GWC1_61_84]HCM26082.1 hypothetical protein [Treponema sp.]
MPSWMSKVRISSPSAGWRYYSDMPVFLSSNLDSEAIGWASSIDGALGTGNGISRYLTPGSHRVEMRSSEGIFRSIIILVEDRRSGGPSESAYLIVSNEQDLYLPEGTQYLGLFALDGSASGLCVAFSDIVPLPSSPAGGERLIRDFRVMTDGANAKRSLKINSSGHARRAIIVPPAIGDKKTFRVTNTANQMAPPHEIAATLVRIGARYTVWIADGSDTDIENIDTCAGSFEDLILPRVSAIWGGWDDVDGDGKIALLFSHTINDEGVAIGYFDPRDLSDRVENASSSSYNSWSNEMDLLYLAVPGSDPDGQYSTSVVSATIAHELTHAVTYARKPVREEVFLDEGWSHLSENLCGFGISGGNVDFLDVFFKDTGRYSFCGPDLLGREDSAGRRGAMTLFLSWLFWRKGGMDWDMDNPSLLIDRGGISFLRRMTESPMTGWESIGDAYGEPTDDLFFAMVAELNRARTGTGGTGLRVDGLTGEPVEFFSGLATIERDESSPMDHAPREYDAAVAIDLPPRSFAFFAPTKTTARGLLPLVAKRVTGSVYVLDYSAMAGSVQ